MHMGSLREQFDAVMDGISGLESVRALGKSGGPALPENGESDIDVFVFSRQIPTPEERLTAYQKALGDGCDCHASPTGGPFWGVCDFLTIAGTELCLMHFTTAQMTAEVDAVLSGSRLEREGNYFYPTGRCASLLSLQVLCDKDGFLAALRQRVATYPDGLACAMAQHHLQKLEDTEDLERGVTRQDPLFYHAALDQALDHFLQALFAANHVYFPSRKRTMEHLSSFQTLPKDCSERLLQTVEWGAKAETLARSYNAWTALCEELQALVKGEESA